MEPASPSDLPVAAETPVAPPCRVAARDAVSRFLGNPNGQAEQMVSPSELTDQEVSEILAAAGDRFTARDGIKAVFSQAYDRRRTEGAEEAQHRSASLRRSLSARKVMERLGASVDESLDTVRRLTAEEIAGLAALDGNADPEDAARAILGPAAARIFGQNPLPDHSPDGIPDLDPGTRPPVAEAATNEPPAASLTPAADEAPPVPPPVNEQGLDAQDAKALQRLDDNGNSHHPPADEPAPAPAAKKKAKK